MIKQSLIGTALLLAATAVGYAAAGRPNIVWFVGDDIGPQEFGCYGHPNIKTPNIDKLAARGVLFTNAFVTTSSCSPSRATMFTGKYPHATGAENLHDALPADQRILPQMLNGYFSGISGKFHLGRATANRTFQHKTGKPQHSEPPWRSNLPCHGHKISPSLGEIGPSGFDLITTLANHQRFAAQPGG